MGKKGKKAQAGKPKKLTPKEIGKRLDALVKKLEEELKGADLFAPLPPMEDCPICFVPLSRKLNNCAYQACCGKRICGGCFIENCEIIKKENDGKEGKTVSITCPFCRELEPSEEGYVHQLEARVPLGDGVSAASLASIYFRGGYGTRRNELKAIDYWIKAIELDSPEACTRIAMCYEGIGSLLPLDKEKAALFKRIGALRGDIEARYSAGAVEYRNGNYEVGILHWKVGAEAGHQPCLNMLKKVFSSDGKMPGKALLSKGYMDSVYRVCHKAQEEIKSEEREKHRHCLFPGNMC